MRGHGKSTMARALTKTAPRLLAFDPNEEHDCALLPYEEFREQLDGLDLSRQHFRLGIAEEAQAEEFCAFAWLIGRRLRELPVPTTLMVLLDEADSFAIPGQEGPCFKRMVRRGRHAGIEIVACSQRPALVSRSLTSQADEVYVFRMQEPKDLAYLRTFMGPDAMIAVYQLEPFEYVRWSAGEWEKGRLGDPTGTASGAEGSNSRKVLTGEPEPA